ncbi:hypothetical protein GO003_024955 [Methylicorpusculum oleiharenae]|uniref:hypothetical protein n=1 Tax=Methylicorpusculum oleiharenae TaxID=1338687 RepID=UPI0013597CD3|nr:hypothetical protein [Methylicorpusculum oleiharenae]MCD2453632.1 hypothetical protein [Methylicorpusculum oleiharenae]
MYSQEIIFFIIQNLLQSNRWSNFEPPSTALSFKLYDTAVGKKEAQVYFSTGDEYNWVLSGLYESQGHNILSTASVLIQKDCSIANLIESCTQFLTDVESRISQSYAVRLL